VSYQALEGCYEELSVQNERKIHVAHLIHTMAYGGIETALLNWMKTFDRNRFQVTLFCFSNPGKTEQPFIDVAKSYGFNVQTIPWNRKKPVFKAARLLAQAVREQKIEIIHSHNTYANLVTLFTARIAPIRTVTTLYVWGNFGFVRNALQWADRLMMRWFDVVSAHCKETYTRTLELGYPADRLKLFVCGYETNPVSMTGSERNEGRAALNCSSSDFVFVNVARFWPEKAHDILLEGFRLVLRQHSNARLWLLGSGPEESSVRNMVEQMQLQDSVQFLGFRSDLERILAMSDVQVHPSDMEGVPLAVCAGLAAGLPVLATEVGGLSEIIRSGENGILIPPRDSQRLAQEMIRLLEDAQFRHQLGEAGKDFIQEEYSLKAAARHVEQSYLELAL